MSEGANKTTLSALATLFSLDRLLSTVVHVAFVAGALFLWINFQVRVLGNDVSLGEAPPSKFARNR